MYKAGLGIVATYNFNENLSIVLQGNTLTFFAKLMIIIKVGFTSIVILGTLFSIRNFN